jgi:hypothetical protein
MSTRSRWLVALSSLVVLAASAACGAPPSGEGAEQAQEAVDDGPRPDAGADDAACPPPPPPCGPMHHYCRGFQVNGECRPGYCLPAFAMCMSGPPCDDP